MHATPQRQGREKSVGTFQSSEGGNAVNGDQIVPLPGGACTDATLLCRRARARPTSALRGNPTSMPPGASTANERAAGRERMAAPTSSRTRLHGARELSRVSRLEREKQDAAQHARARAPSAPWRIPSQMNGPRMNDHRRADQFHDLDSRRAARTSASRTTFETVRAAARTRTADERIAGPTDDAGDGETSRSSQRRSYRTSAHAGHPRRPAARDARRPPRRRPAELSRTSSDAGNGLSGELRAADARSGKSRREAVEGLRLGHGVDAGHAGYAASASGRPPRGPPPRSSSRR